MKEDELELDTLGGKEKTTLKELSETLIALCGMGIFGIIK